MRTIARRAWSVVLALGVAACAGGDAVRAPVVDRSAVAAPAAKRAAAPADAARHVVARGETLYSIAADRGVDVRELAQLNQIDDPGKLRVGQALRLPPPKERAAVPEQDLRTAPAPGVGKVEARPLDAPVSKESAAPGPKPETAGRSGAAKGSERDSGAIRFIWPSKGRLLAGFAEPQRRGVHIGGQIGDPVVAAAPGRVMYTGTGIRGYGKLIIIRHDHGFNSVYAHNREILVKEGDQVARGQKIAELGDSESDKPKLHFEIRRSGKPVDPLKYLPDRPS